jgi:ribonuclease D
MNPAPIETAQELAELAARVAGAEAVALDTEFHNERSYSARLMAVQLVVDDEVAIVDPLRVPDLRPLADAMTRTTVVGHALQSDLKIFADRYESVPAAAFDTQIAAAFLGYGMSISLADLVHDLVGVRLRKSQTVSDWSSRPFSTNQIEYLVDDVIHLLPMRRRLQERLHERGREAWFLEESESLTDLARYRPDPERLYLRLPGATRLNRRELGILRELAELRDQLARERDLPAKYIIPDDVLTGIVHLRPKSREDLAQLRRLDGGTRKNFGDRIVAAVAAGMALPEADLPRKPARPPGHEREALVSALAVLAGAIATRNGLPAGLLVPRSSLERIARELPATPAAMPQTLGASPWRSALIVEPLCDLLWGRTALRVTGAAEGAPHVEAVAS